MSQLIDLYDLGTVCRIYVCTKSLIDFYDLLIGQRDHDIFLRRVKRLEGAIIGAGYKFRQAHGLGRTAGFPPSAPALDHAKCFTTR